MKRALLLFGPHYEARRFVTDWEKKGKLSSVYYGRGYGCIAVTKRGTRIIAAGSIEHILGLDNYRMVLLHDCFRGMHINQIWQILCDYKIRNLSRFRQSPKDAT